MAGPLGEGRDWYDLAVREHGVVPVAQMRRFTRWIEVPGRVAAGGYVELTDAWFSWFVRCGISTAIVVRTAQNVYAVRREDWCSDGDN